MEEVITEITSILGFDTLTEGDYCTREIALDVLKEALTAAYKAGAKNALIPEKSSSVSKRMRELAGIPHKDNYT